MRKKISNVLWVALLMASCGGKESKQFELVKDEVAHVDDCHIKMGFTNPEHDPPIVAISHICGRPESDLDLKAWPKGDPKWSSGIKPPLGCTLGVGDCLLLTETVYCVESVETDK